MFWTKHPFYARNATTSAQTQMTDVLTTSISIGGIALCAMALIQFAFWTTQSLSLISQNKKQFELSRELFRKQIEQNAADAQPKKELAVGHWTGFRTFRVSRLEKETATCTSVYLQAEDGKPIQSFRPGQHLTFRFQIPGAPQPIVRCYSLSDRPDQDLYRISVKSAPSPIGKPDIPPGQASNFINQSLMVNDRIEVKAPSGHFVLDEKSSDPLVLLAGGIGITPMVSIINHLIEKNSERKILLVYGVRNSNEHAFKKHFEHLNRCHTNFCLVNCYSHPNPNEIEGVDFHFKGYASADLLKSILPNNQCQYYMCGPPPFMESIYGGLIQWGVPESRIFFEAFGPASIGKTKKQTGNALASNQNRAPVSFVNSGVTADWDPEFESLLELAEANDVPIESGCRAGSCGTCETTILKGKISYPENQSVDCPPGKCLACIARPDGPVELDL